MSLKGFHIIFVTVVTLFCIAGAVWSFMGNAKSPDIVFRTMGYMLSVVAIVAPIYGVYFYRKSIKNFQ